MRVLVVLLTVCLVGVCYCGDNDGKVARKGSVAQQGGAQAKPVDKPETPQDVSTPVPQPSGQGGLVLDLASLDRDRCQSFDYNFSGHTIKLVVPNKGTTVTKLMNGTEEVYTLSTGETFGYAKAYLNTDGKPELVLIAKRDNSGTKYTYYSRSKVLVWSECDNFGDKMDNLRAPVKATETFVLDVSVAQSVPECSIIKTRLFGVPTKLYFTNPGHLAKEVVNGKETIWKGSGDDKCSACYLYLKGNEPLLVFLVIESNGGKVSKYFEKNGEEWKGIEKTPFNEKLDDLRAVDPEVPQDNTEDQSENSTTHSDEQSGFDDSASQDAEFSEAANKVTTVEHEEQTPQESGSDHSEEQLQTEQATSDSQPDTNTNEEPKVVPSETSATETLDLASPDDSKVDFSNGDDKRNVVEASEKGEESTPPLDIDGNTQTKSFENSTEWNDHSNERSLGQESQSLGTSELRGSRTSISSRRQNRRDSTASTISTTSTASTISLNQTSGSTSLKLLVPDDSIYQSFEYYHDDNHIKLVLPQEDVTVTKLLESRSTIWTGKTGEVLEYARVYLKKDGKPGFVRVWKRDSSGVKCVNYTTGRFYGWSEFKGDVSTKINPLKVATEYKGASIIDLKKDEDTKKCRIFSVNFLGVPTRSYSPKPGYYATEVMDGDESLWKASEGTDERYLSCELYTKYEQRLLYLSKRKNGKRDDASFEFSDGEWKNITEDEFHRRFQAMVDGPSQESTDSLDTRKVENEPLPSASPDDVKVEGNEHEHISEECKDPEISSVPDTEAPEEAFTDLGFSESEQTGPGEHKSETISEDTQETPSTNLELEASEPTEDIPTEPEPKENTLEQSTETALEVKTLDLSAIDSSLDLLDDETQNGVHSKSYILQNENFERISEDGMEIWTAEGGEKLLLLNLHSKGDLALLNICTKKNHKLMLGYFAKNGNGWKSLKDDEFDQKYGEMKETESL